MALYPYGRVGRGVGTTKPTRPAGGTGVGILGSPMGALVSSGHRSAPTEAAAEDAVTTES